MLEKNAFDKLFLKVCPLALLYKAFIFVCLLYKALVFVCHLLSGTWVSSVRPAELCLLFDRY